MAEESRSAHPEPEADPTAAPEPERPAPAVTGSSLPPVIPAQPDTGYTPTGVPTLEGVREKIETRYATALGAAELAHDTAAGHSVTQRYEQRQKAAADKLEEIRAAMPEPAVPESEGKPD